MAAVAMIKITKTDEVNVAVKMIVLSSRCNVELMLEEVDRVVVTIEANDEFEVGPKLLVGFTVTVKFIGSGWPIHKNRQHTFQIHDTYNFEAKI